MNARFKAITAALVLVGAAAQAGEQGPGNHDRPGPVAMNAAAVAAPPADAFPVAQRASAAQNPARDPASGIWAMLLAGFLGAGAIARRRL